MSSPMVPPQLNVVTLCCQDVERMAEFFRALGWPESPASEPVHRVFQLPNGVVLGINVGQPRGGRCRSRGSVEGRRRPRDERAPRLGAWLHGLGFRDPEGNISEVVWKHGSRVDEQGHLTFEP